jgi:hypothetical protein
LIKLAQQIKIELYVAMAITEDIKNFHLLDVGVLGENVEYLNSDQKVIFRNLKFKTNSLQMDRNNFHLVIVAKNQNDEVIDSKISPPVIVLQYKEGSFS